MVLRVHLFRLFRTLLTSGGESIVLPAEYAVQDDSACYFWAKLVQATATMAGRFAAIR